MEKFDERKKSFEKKFAHDEELKFKVASRRNKYLGQWASQKLGYDTEKEKEYIQSVIKADFQEAGDEDVFRKIKADLKDHNVSDEDIRNKILVDFEEEVAVSVYQSPELLRRHIRNDWINEVLDQLDFDRQWSLLTGVKSFLSN